MRKSLPDLQGQRFVRTVKGIIQHRALVLNVANDVGRFRTRLDPITQAPSGTIFGFQRCSAAGL